MGTRVRNNHLQRLLDAAAGALVLADIADECSLLALRGHLADAADAFAAAASPGARLVCECANLAEGLLADDSAEQKNRTLATLNERFAEIGEAMAGPAPASAGAQAAIAALHEDATLVADFVARALEHLDTAEDLLLALERHPDDPEAIDGVFRAFHTIKGMAGFLGFDDIGTLTHEAEGSLEPARRGDAMLDTGSIEILLAQADTLRNLVSGRLRIAGQPLAADAPGMTAAQANRVGRSVRVDENRLDALLDAVGELVIAETMAFEIARQTMDDWGAASERFSQLDKITRNLQAMATSLRMVPVQSTFRRMARMAHDLAREAGKEITLVTSGEDTELDRSLVDAVYDALVHLLRNAIDHGIETPAERLAAGKPAAGTLTLRAFHQGGAVLVELADDGRGVDVERVLAKGRQAGLVGETDVLTEREVLDLIFAPGFSTAEQVTAVSGRGVGMDAVRRAVEELRGQVDVRTAPDAGTTFTVRVPLTLAVIDGMAVRVGGERYVLPMASIERSVRPETSDLTAVLGRGITLSVGDSLVPVVSLGELFELEGAEADPTKAIVVVVEDGVRRAGLLACEILGQQQVVIKPLGDCFRGMPGLAGGAIMPDGRVGLVIDVAGLVDLAHSEGSR